MPFDPNWLQHLLFASLLIIVLLVRPEGIIREGPTKTISGTRLKSLVDQIVKGRQRGSKRDET